MAVHVFFDNSNVIWGARYACIDLEPQVYEYAIRLHFENLFSLIEGGRDITTKVLAGSAPPSCDALWAYAEKHGYTTDLLRKVEREDGTLGEQGVDELFHLKIANALLDNDSGILAIATGDGKVSKFGTGFLTQIDRALAHGWDVELWSWSQVCHHKYQEYNDDPSKRFKLHLLNFHYYDITFLRGGEYYRDLPNGVRQHIRVTDRPARPLLTR